jgi:hypothetical protein
MPQPLSKFLPPSGEWGYKFGEEAFEKEPHLALLFARVILRHSAMESAMGHLLIKILDAHAAPGYAMFSAITSTSGKTAALGAAADSMLSGAELQAFHVVSRLVKAMSKERNKLAHDLWGYSTEVPGALITTKPTEFQERTIAFDYHWRNIFNTKRSGDRNPTSIDLITPNTDKIFVYREADFQRILSNINETILIISLLSNLASGPVLPEGVPSVFPKREQLLRQLCRVPLFQQERYQIRASRRKSRATQKR